MEDEPTLWEYEDAMRFVSPATFHLVDHDDGDYTLEGHGAEAEISDGWMADTKRRIDALNRAGISTRYLNALIGRMSHARIDAELRATFELFEATLDGMMDDLIEALHAKYED